VARSWGDSTLREGDEVLLTVMEHHSNLVPWQLLAQRTGCVLRHVGLTEDGRFDLEDFQAKLSERTRLVSLVHISNTLGCCNPLDSVIPAAHAVGALVLVDACQSLAHQSIDVVALEADFLVGSSHKLCGPTGMGFLWARESLLEEMPPFLGGGEMIQDVFLDHSTWAVLPHKFEAGTPAIGEAVGMGAGLRYLQEIGLEAIQAWEALLTQHLFSRLQAIDGLRILGPTPEQQPGRGALATFSCGRCACQRHRGLDRCLRHLYSQWTSLLSAVASPVWGDGFSSGQPQFHQHHGRNRLLRRGARLHGVFPAGAQLTLYSPT
jgi:cysteine desulfurase/selenocysteine lyase